MSDQELLAAGDLWKILGRRWTLAILHSLASAEAMRFTELRKAVIGISGTMLSERLLELEAQGLLSRKIYESVPPKVEYSLTASARELVDLMGQICRWYTRWTSRQRVYGFLSQSAR
jgi:DNA-binding HxlR family transcriptional regulator